MCAWLALACASRAVYSIALPGLLLSPLLYLYVVYVVCIVSVCFMLFICLVPQAKALSDFLLPMLRFVPEERATAAQMLNHPWLRGEPAVAAGNYRQSDTEHDQYNERWDGKDSYADRRREHSRTRSRDRSSKKSRYTSRYRDHSTDRYVKRNRRR